MDELERLKQQFIDEIKTGRTEEAARTFASLRAGWRFHLAQRDELLLHGLVTTNDIAQLLGVGQSAVSAWKKRHKDFPAPVVGEGRTARYSRAEVLTWWAARHPTLVKAIRVSDDYYR